MAASDAKIQGYRLFILELLSALCCTEYAAKLLRLLAAGEATQLPILVSQALLLLPFWKSLAETLYSALMLRPRCVLLVARSMLVISVEKPQRELPCCCSRPSMQALFDDRKMGTQRASAEVCLPRLPGPSDPGPSDPPPESAEQQEHLINTESKVSNDNLHQGDTHAARSAESFDLPSITKYAFLASQKDGGYSL